MQKVLREIKEVVNNQIQIFLPDYFDTKQVEVIIFPVYIDDNPKSVTETKTDYNNYFGVSNIGIETIDNYINKSRNEWDRKISD